MAIIYKNLTNYTKYLLKIIKYKLKESEKSFVPLLNNDIKLFFLNNLKIKNLKTVKQLSLKICPKRLIKIQNYPPIKQLQSLIAFWLLLYALKFNLKITHKLEFFKINGKLHLKFPKNVFFNLSHTNDAAVCALATSEIGVDIETVRPINLNLAKKICCYSELIEFNKISTPNDFLIKLWTIKESYAKMKANSIFYNLQNLNYRNMKNIQSIKLKNYIISISCKTNTKLKIKQVNFKNLLFQLKKLKKQ